MNINAKKIAAPTRIAIDAAREAPGNDMPLQREQITGLAGLEKKRAQADIDWLWQCGQSTSAP
jgi:hypothetical protein